MVFRIQRTQATISGRGTGVRADIDVRTGGQQVAQAVSGLGGALQDLGIKADLVEATTQLSESRRQARERINALKLELDGIDDTSLFGERTTKALDDLGTFIPKNGRAARQYQEFVNDITPSVNNFVVEKARSKQKDNFMAELFKTKVESERTGNTSPFEVMLGKGRIFDFITKEESEKMSRDTLVNGERNFINELIRSGRTSDAFTAIEKSHLKATEKTSLENSVTNRELQIRNLSNEAYQDRQGDASANFNDLFNKGELTDETIDILDLQAIGKQKTAETKFKQQWKKILRENLKLGDPLVSNEDVYDSLTVGSELVERGTKSPAEWEDEFREALTNRELSPADRRTLRSKDIVATKTMQNSSFTQTTIDNRPNLVELKEDEISSLISARNVAVQLKDIKSVNVLNFSLKKAQAQKWNYGRYRTDLRTQIAQNPEWSQKQIFIASSQLIEKYDIDDADLLVQFDTQSPDQSILLTPPDDRLNDVWEGLSQSDKAKVWEIRLNGGSIEEILGAL